MHGDRSMTNATANRQVKDAEQVNRPAVAKLLRVLAIPIIVFWLLVAVVTNVFVPSLDLTTSANAGPLVARRAIGAGSDPHGRRLQRIRLHKCRRCSSGDQGPQADTTL